MALRSRQRDSSSDPIIAEDRVKYRFEKLLNLPSAHLIGAFLPWIFFSTVHSYSFSLASVGALVMMGLLNFRELKRGFVMPWGSAFVFAILGLNNLFLFSEWIERNHYILMNSGLAAIIWFSMIIGRPFTLQYAREEVDASRWHHPLFLKINWILTGIWAVLMTISALPVYFLTQGEISASWFWSYGLNILCIVIGFKSNKSIPKLFKKVN